MFVSCDKEEEVEELVIEQSFSVADQGSNDESARNAYDNAVDDVFNALNNTNLKTGRLSKNAIKLPCGVKKIDSLPNSYKFVYGSGADCGRKIRSGSITASLTNGNAWNDTGAVLTLTFTNYTIEYTNVTPHQTIVINGTFNITNQNGGYTWETWFNNRTIVHNVTGSINIDFDNNTTRAWLIAKKRTYTAVTGLNDLVMTWSQIGTYAEQGVNRAGDNFTTTFPTPIEFHWCQIGGDYYVKAFKGSWLHSVPPNSIQASAGYLYDSKNPTYIGDCTSDGFLITYNINGNITFGYLFY